MQYWTMVKMTGSFSAVLGSHIEEGTNQRGVDVRRLLCCSQAGELSPTDSLPLRVYQGTAARSAIE